MQPTRPFPPEVYQTAQAAGLGSPTKEYNVWDRFVLAGQGKASKKRSGTFFAWRCRKGLIYHQHSNFHAIRWEQLATVTRQTARVWGGNYVTVRYIVQPVDAPPFDFVTMNGPEAQLIRDLHTARKSVSMTGGDGPDIEAREGFIIYSAYANLSAYAGLGELLEKHLNHQLPLLLAAYQSGAGVPFGSLVFSQHGLTVGTRVFLWSEIAALEISESETALQITRKPTGLEWLYYPLLDFPNVALLLAFLKSISSGGALMGVLSKGPYVL